MLDSLRNLMGGVVAKILIGLLVISFAVWGASDAFIGGAGTNAVTVGDTKVGLVDYRLAYLNHVNRIQRQVGQRLTREQLRAFGVENAVLSQVVTGAVLEETARNMGLGISDDKLATLIGEDPTFQDSTGAFSRTNLEFALRQAGMREQDYIRNRESFAVRTQLVDALSLGVDAPEAFIRAYAAYQSQKRTFRYVMIGRDDVDPPGEPSESDLETLYQDTRGRYVAPEYRELVLVRLKAEDIADPDAIPEEEVRAEYDRTKDSFARPDRRRVEQLNFSDTTAAEEAAERLAGGESFDTIMEEMGRAPEDVDLGLLTRDEIPDQNIADAAFSLDVNETSEVVTGIFGPVILRITEIQEGEIKPLEAVEDEIRRSLALDRASDELYDIHDQLEDERAAGDRLAEAARKVGLEPRIIEAVDADGNDPAGEKVKNIPQAEEVLAEAFDTDEGVEADPISLGASGFVWYEVAGITPERQKPLSEVREEVADAWRRRTIEDSVIELAESFRDRVEAGETLDAVAADLLGSPDGSEASFVETSAELTRNDTSDDLGREAVQAGFSVPPGQPVVAAGPKRLQRLVLEVETVVDAEGELVQPQVEQRLNQTVSGDLTTTVVTDLQEDAEIAIDRQAIETAITY